MPRMQPQSSAGKPARDARSVALRKPRDANARTPRARARRHAPERLQAGCCRARLLLLRLPGGGPRKC
jgi:hypothetical protein